MMPMRVLVSLQTALTPPFSYGDGLNYFDGSVANGDVGELEILRVAQIGSGCNGIAADPAHDSPENQSF